MNVYWWRTVRNFGDWLTDTLLTHLGVDHKWAEPGNADLVVTGSVLEHLPCCWPGTVVGAGKLHETSELHLEHTNVLAVRGPLTAAHLFRDCAIGDPGLMASLIINPQAARYDLGVIPHWSDPHLPSRFAYGHVIRPENGPMHVMTEIARCRKVVSSSLHGVIVADAFGIPRQAEQFPRMWNAAEGGDFKWRDYAASIGDKPRFGEMVTANHNLVAVRQREIEHALAQIR